MIVVLPVADVILGAPKSRRRFHAHVRLIGARLMHGFLVGYYQRVLALLMTEEVVNSFLFHQARNKIECRLPVLHAVRPGLVLTGELQLIVGEPELVEDLLDNFGYTLFLKDAAVGGACKEPQP